VRPRAACCGERCRCGACGPAGKDRAQPRPGRTLAAPRSISPIGMPPSRRRTPGAGPAHTGLGYCVERLDNLTYLLRGGLPRWPCYSDPAEIPEAGTARFNNLSPVSYALVKADAALRSLSRTSSASPIRDPIPTWLRCAPEPIAASIPTSSSGRCRTAAGRARSPHSRGARQEGRRERRRNLGVSKWEKTPTFFRGQRLRSDFCQHARQAALASGRAAVVFRPAPARRRSMPAPCLPQYRAAGRSRHRGRGASPDHRRSGHTGSSSSSSRARCDA
jgi:hypothetical protein